MDRVFGYIKFLGVFKIKVFNLLGLIFSILALLFLLATTNAQKSTEALNNDQLEEDEGPPLFNAVSGRHPPAPLPIEKIRSASFGDSNQGKIVWRVEKGQLPWRGSYSFLG